MNTVRFRSAVASLVIASVALAAESVTGDVPTPVTSERTAPPAGMVTFLGVAYAPTSRLLSARFGLAEGVGLVVTGVVNESPAAGVLRTDDILISLDSLKLTEPAQFATLVRSHLAGDNVTLVYLRAGKEGSATLKLSQRAITALPPGAVIGETNPKYEEIPRDEMSAAEQEMHDRGYSPVRESATYQAGDTKLNYTDSTGVIDVTRAAGKMSVVAKNPAGAVIWAGAFNTDAERLAAPPSVQARVEWLLADSFSRPDDRPPNRK